MTRRVNAATKRPDAVLDDAELERIREGSRAMWAAGDYPVVADRLRPVAHELVQRAGVGAGDRVLDVGTGSGSVAVTAATCGAVVIGIDHIDTWFPAARASAEAAGATVELVVADAEDLPYPDGAFDVVLSNFAHMFAPRHDVVAGEMARVCRSGGTVAFTVWATDDHDESSAFAIIGQALSSAAASDDAPAPIDTPDQWGRPDYAIERFARHGVELTLLQPGSLRWTFASLDALDELLLTASGPYIKAREALESVGAWEQVWAEVREFNRGANVATDGTYALDQPYLIAVGRKRR
jgi:SAM-dependent methyltransferase